MIKNSIKELCYEDRAKLGDMIQQIAIEKAKRKQIEELKIQNTKSLDEKIEELKKEQEKLLEESEILHESLANSISRIETIQNTPSISMHTPSISLTTPLESKNITPDTSIYKESKEIESTTVSVQMSIDKEIQSENIDSVDSIGKNKEKQEYDEFENSFVRKRNFESRGDVKKVIEKALETSARLEKIFLNDRKIGEESASNRNNFKAESDIQSKKELLQYQNIKKSNAAEDSLPKYFEKFANENANNQKGRIFSVEKDKVKTEHKFHHFNNCGSTEDKTRGKESKANEFVENDVDVFEKHRNRISNNDDIDEIIIIEEPFYDSSILNVIDEMEDFE